MALFSWAMKGVNIEKKSRSFSTEPMASMNIPTETVMGVADTPVELQVTPQEQAAAVLFDYGTQASAYGQNAHMQYGQQASQPIFSTPVTYQPQQTASQPSSFGSAFAGNTLGNRHILVVAPRNDSEVLAIVDHLKTNTEAVIVNFEGVPTCETQRRIDFLSGVACGLGGSIRPLDNYKFILTPSGIGVR